MEILRIGKYAVKVSLDTEEALNYKLLDKESKNENDIKLEIERLLEKVTEKIDFTYSGRRLFTEIYPSKNGGCEVFISTINYDESKTHENKRGKFVSLYAIDTIERMLKICFRLNEISFDGKSSVYYDATGKKYYLLLENVFTKELKYAFLLEYAKQVKSSSIGYIKEHYKCIIKKNGVKLLAALAN
jgi:hypothetical protein